MIIFSFALMLYGVFHGLKLGEVNCFAWYSPFASVFRTGAQNTYCNVLRSTNQIFAQCVQGLMNSSDIGNFLTKGIAAGVAVGGSYKAFVTFMRKFNAQVAVLVKFILNDKSQTEEKRNNGIKCAMKPLIEDIKKNIGIVSKESQNEAEQCSDAEPSEEEEEEEDSGGASKRKKRSSRRKRSLR